MIINNSVDVMVDIETMGMQPNGAIVSIGAVLMDMQEHVISDSFYVRIDLADAVKAGGTLNPSTILWWMQQSEEARAEVTTKDGRTLKDALRSFTAFLSACPKKYSVWGNGVDFDNVMLRASYEMVGLETPWRYTQNRCFRTVRELHAHVKPLERQGTHHNALDDAIYQAEYLFKILQSK